MADEIHELWEQNLKFPPLQAHLFLQRDSRVTDATTLQAHIFGVTSFEKVCEYKFSALFGQVSPLILEKWMARMFGVMFKVMWIFVNSPRFVCKPMRRRP